MASEDKEIRWSKKNIFKQSSAGIKKKKEDDDKVTMAGRAFEMRDDQTEKKREKKKQEWLQNTVALKETRKKRKSRSGYRTQ